MKRKNIKRNELIRGGLLLAAGILLGALIFSSSGKSKQFEENREHTHAQSDTAQEAGEDNTTWTCSMHPQVRQDEPGNCPICGMELIPAEESDADQDPAELKMTEEAIKLADVQTTRVRKKVPQKEIRLTGKINVDQRRIYTQPSHFPGRIEKLYLNFKGEYVQEGQTIASVYSPELISAQEELLEAIQSGKTNPQLLEAARAKLRQWKLNEDQIAAIEEKGEITERMEIKAGTSGIVHKKMVNEGDYINKGSVLYHIAKIDTVWIMFDAYQEDVPLIEQGDQIEYTVSGIPGETFNSTVNFIDPLMNEKSRVAKVRAETNNRNGLLKPGMFVEGVMTSGNLGSGEELIVPSSSVMWTGKRSVVYIKIPNRKEPTYALREVVLGASLGEEYIVKKGLEENEEVVTHGTFAVDAATQLAGKSSMMNRRGGRTSTGHEHHQMEEEETDQNKPMTEMSGNDVKWPESQLGSYQNLTKHYMALKNALVNDRKDTENANKMLDALASIDMKAFPQKAHSRWMNLYNKLENNAKAIAETEELAAQRKHFIALSDAMINLVKTFKAPDDTLFVQFCPMADDNQGAFWLSSEDQVRNPYFGDQMLTCGEVREKVEKQ